MGGGRIWPTLAMHGTHGGWVFLDETNNARWKWCMMGVCGSGAKAARHYAEWVAK